MKVSPNPVEGNINLKIDKVSDTSRKELIRLEKGIEEYKIPNFEKQTKMFLFDINSNQLIKTWTFNEINNNQYNLEISGIKSGWYILKLERESTNNTTKIFIE